ncbi:hypothetical protein [Nannocystis pusilla]|uniref:hypothetical protein n=1 Tax=Nannocystis pusilla TaxID=889268 RepID=UPI003B7978FC
MDGEDLVVEFKEAGVPSGATETITVTGTFNATAQCINKGGINPNDPKKTQITSEGTASGSSPRTRAATSPAPWCWKRRTSTFPAPGQTRVISNERWTDVTITDEDTDASLSLGNFTIQ